MYTVALVQNQSEMAHYGYADARPLIEEMHYRQVLYTALNIRELSADMKRERFDAIFFASNALNDKTIRNAVLTAEFKEEFSNYLQNKKGCLLLHQLRLAQEKVRLSFLPEPLDLVQPKERDSEEKASEGNLLHTDITMTNPCFLYPNSIDVSSIKSQCLSFPSLRGLYWHYFENISRSDWDLLIFDVDKKKTERPLVLAAKESEPFRIVLSALTLDWQMQKKLLRNILTFVVEGRHRTAIIRDFQKASVAMDYFIESLRSDKYPFRVYDLNQNLSDFMRNAKAGVHTLVILDPFVDKARIGNDNFALLEQHIKEGKIKLIGIDSDTELRKFYVAGKERFALRILHDLEMRIQQELYESGYIDGSFWSTVESLQILTNIPNTNSKFDKQTLARTFEKANKHDRGGSYDEVFAVSCALLWLRAKYEGKKGTQTERTLTWIRKNLPNYEDRERVLAYLTLISVGLATENEKRSLRNILLSQTLTRLSEIDLIVYLRAAVAVGENKILIPIAKSLEKKQEGGYWIDLATSAEAVTALLEILALLEKNDTTEYAQNRSFIESMIYNAIINLQASREDTSGKKGASYPWDNKASTSLKCVQTWLRFEEMIDFPVHEIIDTMASYSGLETSKSSTSTALAILEEIKKENRKLRDDNNKLSIQVTKEDRNLKRNRLLWILLTITLYVLLSVVVYSLLVGINTPMNVVLEGAFIRGWPFHLAVLSLVVAVSQILPVWKKHKEGQEK